MKYVKKNQKKRKSLIFRLIFVLVVASVTMILLFGKFGEDISQADPDKNVVQTGEEIENPVTTEMEKEPVKTEAIENTEILDDIEIGKTNAREYDVIELVDGQIRTPYCTLNYPEGLADLLLVINTSKQPYTLAFCAVMEAKHELRLFDLSWGEESGGNAGVITTSDGEVPLNVTVYSLETDENWSESEITTAYAMQDVVNDLIEQMNPQNEDSQTDVMVISQQPDDSSTVYNLEIETPYATLCYPARWANTVLYDCDDSQDGVYRVHFYGQIDGMEKQLLFSVYFGGDEGEQIGAVMGNEGIPVPVYLIMAYLQTDGLEEADMELLFAMQEASNQLIARLPLLQ